MPRPVKVLILLANLAGGGAERTVVRLMENIDREKFQPKVGILWSEGPFLERVHPDDLLQAHLPKLGCTSYPRLVIDILKAHNRMLREFQPDVVLSLTVSMNIAAHFALTFYGRKHTGWILREGNNTLRMLKDDVSNPILAKLRQWITGVTYRGADKILAISQGLGQGLAHNFQVDPSKVQVIYNPVETQAVERTPAHPPMILSVGRLVYQKGFDLLLEAFAQLNHPTAKLVILGEGKERESLTEKIQQLGLQDRVEMPGFCNDVSQYFRKATAFVLSSRWEGFGCVVIEAMACGLPVVVTNCDYGPPEIVSHEVNGLVVEHSSAEALTQGVERIINDEELAQHLGEAAVQRAEEFSVQEITRQYEALLFSVVKS